VRIYSWLGDILAERKEAERQAERDRQTKKRGYGDVQRDPICCRCFCFRNLISGPSLGEIVMIREIRQGRWAVYNAKGIVVIITRYRRIAEKYFERVNS